MSTLPRRIDRRQASRIADAFLAAPRHAPDEAVVAAYAALSEQSSRWYQRLTGTRGRHPVRVVLTHQGRDLTVVDDPSATYFGLPIDDTTLVPHGDAELGATALSTWLAQR